MFNPIYDALDAYYNTQFVLDEDSPDYDESAVIFDNGIPLEKRENGILQKIETFLAEGVDLNEAPDGFYPLKAAVRNHDALMVRYLIQHGADCRKWLGEDEEPDPDVNNWYLDAVDSNAMDESIVTNPNTAKFEALMEIACIMVKEGGLQEPYDGYCLKVTEDREIIFCQAQVKF